MSLKEENIDIPIIFKEFIYSNVEQENYEFIYTLYQTGAMPDSLLITILLCELGSHKKTYFDLDIQELEPYSVLLKSTPPLSKPKYLQFGLESLKKCKE